MIDIFRLLFFIIPLGSIGILATLETITPSQADWMAFTWIALWYLRYFREFNRTIKKIFGEKNNG